MHRGFITIHRKIVDWEWYSDANVFRVFTHLILTANWEPRKWKGVPVKRGQKITSIQHMAEETGLTEQSVRTAIKKLKLTGEITTKATNKYTIVTLTNYDFYQDKEKQITNKTTSNLTNEQQTTNKQLTTTKPLNNITIKTNKEEPQSKLNESKLNKETRQSPEQDTEAEKITNLLKPLNKISISPLEIKNLVLAAKAGCTQDTVKNLLRRKPAITGFSHSWQVDELMAQLRIDKGDGDDIDAELERRYGKRSN